ncbi:hypothetical protein HYX58_05510 [Candidatus Dependentiae bacterium]|nr:hypothetical protein [Candidatus Dependentiae bacterium]
MKKHFSIKSALWFGFSTVIEHFAFFIAVMLIYLGVMVGAVLVGLPITAFPFATQIMQIVRILNAAGVSNAELIKNVIMQTGPAFSIAVCILSLLLYTLHRLMALGLVKISLDFYDHDRSTLKTLFSCWRLLVRDVIATFLYWLMCAIGFALLIVPGIYLVITFGFYQYAIVDEDAGVFESFRRSAQITKGHKMDLVGLVFLLSIIRWAALSFFGVTLLIVIPAAALIYAHAYRKLISQAK